MFLLEEELLLLVLVRENSSREDRPVHPALHHSDQVGHQEHAPVKLKLPKPVLLLPIRLATKDYIKCLHI